jgi:hypothetical protein
MPTPLRLSDTQLDQVLRAARPLHTRDRGAFLRAVADGLRDCPEPGDGQVFRVVAEAQRRFYDAPTSTDNDGHKRMPRGTPHRRGQLMKETPKARGGGDKKSNQRVRKRPGDAPSLAAQGVDKHLADRARKMAALTESQFERIVKLKRKSQPAKPRLVPDATRN